jgi:uncharacterized protein (DUF433 family)
LPIPTTRFDNLLHHPYEVTVLRGKARMKPLDLVTEDSQAIENILKFDREMHHPELRERLAYVRDWYATQVPGRGWVFGSSKFIGYRGIDYKAYERLHNKGLDGRTTEKRLKRWFVLLEPPSKLREELLQALERVVARHGKTVNALARIHVSKGEMRRPDSTGKPLGSENWRITSDPGILAGKPCIRGMRIRVADILEMLSHGATRQEILEDYPYLEDGDITAALEFAIGAVDHRLVKAA